MNIRIGTRGSDLALWQANHVADRLQQAGATTEIVVLKTRGDLIDDVPLTGVEGKAFFTAEIERALADGEVDLAVHSHKDLPTEEPPGLTVVATPPRASSGERLLVRPEAHAPDAPGAALLPLAPGARVGTSAPRRAEQVQALRPDLSVEHLRGNVPTRVRTLREGQYEAILLAAAGLDRLELDLSDLVVVDLASDRLTPAPAQGALAIQTRARDAELIELVRGCLHDETTEHAIAAERSLLQRAGGGCSLPLGACVEATDNGWRARAFLGAGHPTADCTRPRWSEAEAATPAEAIEGAWSQLESGAPTGCGPLAGTTVALTGSGIEATHFGTRLETLGATVRNEQVLSFEPLAVDDLAQRLGALGAGDALAITSRQAARRLAGLADALRPAPERPLVCAVGASSAKALRRAGFEVDLVGTGGARELAEAIPIQGGRVLFPCAEDALDELEQVLAARGIPVDRLPVYRTVPEPRPELDPAVAARVYMSPSAVRAASGWERAQAAAEQRTALRFAVGPTTAAALEEHGLAAHVTPPRGPLAASEALIQHLTRLAAAGEL